MTLLKHWQNQLPHVYTEFAKLAAATPEVEAGPGLIGAAILWVIRPAIQEFDGETLDAVRTICGPEAKHIFKAVQSWDDDPLAAARALAAQAKENLALAEALNKLSQYFQATAPFAEALAQALVAKQGYGDVYNIAGQINAALVNIGGTTNIQSLTFNLGGLAPEPHRAPFTVPLLPRHFVERPAEYEQLRRLLLAHGPGRTVGLTTAFQGGGGFGKTTLALALGHDKEVRAAFPDGILFITLGEKPANLRGLLLDQLHLFQPTAPDFTDPIPAATRLREELANRRVLLILDDVWAEADARPFIQSGPGCAHLITTRRQDVASDLRALTVHINEMTTAEAATLLGNWLDKPPADRTALLEFAHYLGEWPLLLELAAAQLRQRVELDQQTLSNAIADLRLRLERKGFTYFDRTDEGERNRAISLSLTVSLEWLGHWRDRYLELAVFHEAEAIPFQAIHQLWSQTASFEEIDSADALQAMQRLSLFTRYDSAPRTVRLHNVIRRYLVEQQGHRLPVLHQQLLIAYRSTQTGDGWATAPDDGYLYDHLAYHLIQAGHLEELVRLLTASSDWMMRKRDVFTVDTSYIADLEAAIREFSDPLSAARLKQLVSLWAAWQVAHQRSGQLLDTDLKTLTLLGRSQEALVHARLRSKPRDRLDGILAIYHSLREMGQDATRLLDALVVTWREAHWTDRIECSETVVNILAESGWFAEAEEIISRLPHRSYAYEEALRGLAVHLAWAGRFEAAENTAGTIGSAWIRAETLAQIAALLAQAGHPGAETFFTAVSAVVFDTPLPDSQTASLADFAVLSGRSSAIIHFIRSLVAAEKFAEAEKAALTLQREQQGSDTMMELVKELAGLGRYGQAEQVAQAIQNKSTKAKVYQDLAVALALQQQEAEAERLFATAQRLINADKLSEDKGRALRDIAMALLSAGFSDKAAVAIAEAEAAASSYQSQQQQAAEAAPERTWSDINSLSELLADGPPQILERANKLLGEIQQTRKRIEAFIALQQTHDVLRAATLIGTIEEDQVRMAIYSDLVIWLAQAGRASEARILASEMNYIDKRVETLAIAAKTFAYIGQLEEAQQTLREAVEFAHTIQTLGQDYMSTQLKCLRSLALAAAEARCFNEAQEIFNHVLVMADLMTDGPAWQETLSGLGIALVRAGRTDQARRVAEMISDSEKLSYVWRELAQTLVKEARLEEAVQVARTIADPAVQAHTLIVCGVLNPKKESLEESKALFIEATQLVSLIQDHASQTEILNRLANAFAWLADFDRLINVARMLLQNDWRGAYELIEVVFDLDQQGHTTPARMILAEIKQTMETAPIPDSLQLEDAARYREIWYGLVAALTLRGRPDEAYQIVQSLIPDYFKVMALTEFGIALTQTSNHSAAVTAFDEAEAMVLLVEPGLYRDGLLRRLVAALVQCGYTARAEQVASLANDQVGTLIQLALALVKSGQKPKTRVILDKVSKFIQNMEDDFRQGLDKEDDWHYLTKPRLNEMRKKLVSALGDAGFLTEAVEIARTIQDPVIRREALPDLGRQLWQDKQYDQAREIFKETFEAILAVKNQDPGKPFLLLKLAHVVAQVGEFEWARIISSAIPQAGLRADAQRELQTALAQAGQFAEALAESGPVALNQHIQTLANWVPHFEKMALDLSIEILKETIRIAAWVRPEWNRVFQVVFEGTD